MKEKPDANLVVVAQIAGAHGVRGDVRIRSFTEYPEDCFAYGALLSGAGNVLVTPKKVTAAKDTFIVWPEENRQREEWIEMKGTLLYVSRSDLPEPEEDEFYFNDLIGCQVQHIDGRDLGEVVHVQNYGADDLIELKWAQSGTYFLPFTKATIPRVDINSRQLIAEPEEALLPDGLRIDDDETEDDDAS